MKVSIDSDGGGSALVRQVKVLYPNALFWTGGGVCEAPTASNGALDGRLCGAAVFLF